MLNDFKITQARNKWQTYILRRDFVKIFLRGSSSSLREIIFAIEPPPWVEGIVLCDGAMMSIMAESPL